MSFDDAEILGGHSIGYDEYPGVRMDDFTDLDLLYDNRATRYGEPPDTLWPLSNFRGGWANEGSGPRASYSSQLGSPLNTPPGRNIEWDRNQDVPLSDILKNQQSTKDSIVKNALELLTLEKLKRHKDKFENAPTGASSTQSFWASQNTTSLLLIFIFILLVATIIVQHMHTRRLTDIIQLIGGRSPPLPP